MNRALVIATLLTSCAGAADAPPSRMCYSVAPELANAFEATAKRIKKVSGVQISSSGGIEISAVPLLMNEEQDDYLCGRTIIGFYKNPYRVVSLRIEIMFPQPDKCDLERTIAHELIHTMRAPINEGANAEDHSADGAFAENSGDSRFTESTLSAMCEAVACPAFNPED